MNPRLSITFTARQLVLLQAEAARLGVPVAEVVRRIIDSYLEKNQISGAFDGSISGIAMSVDMTTIPLRMGMKVRGPGVASGTVIVMQYSGEEGGPGLYFVDKRQTVCGSVLSASF